MEQHAYPVPDVLAPVARGGYANREVAVPARHVVDTTNVPVHTPKPVVMIPPPTVNNAIPSWAKSTALVSSGLGVMSVGVGAGTVMIAEAAPGLMVAAKALAIGFGCFAGFIVLSGAVIAYIKGSWAKSALAPGGDTYVTNNINNEVTNYNRGFGRSTTTM